MKVTKSGGAKENPAITDTAAKQVRLIGRNNYDNDRTKIIFSYSHLMLI